MTIFNKGEKLLHKVTELPTDRIIPNPHQPRMSFDDEELALLAESIK